LNGITEAMDGTRARPPDNFQRDQNQTVPTFGTEPARKGTGWVDPLPLANPPGQDIIRRIVDRFEPQSPEWILRSAKLTADQLGELRGMVTQRPDAAWLLPIIDRVACEKIAEGEPKR
jgi:hypothetical protein